MLNIVALHGQKKDGKNLCTTMKKSLNNKVKEMWRTVAVDIAC